MYLQRLGLPAPSSDTGSDRESQRQGSTDQPGYVHTLLTLLLTADGTAACRTSQQQELWQQGHSAMVALLDAVYTEVGGLAGWRFLSALPFANLVVVANCTPLHLNHVHAWIITHCGFDYLLHTGGTLSGRVCIAALLLCHCCMGM